MCDVPRLLRAHLDISRVSREFSGGLEGKVSACNVGNLGLIPGSGRSPGEGNGNPLLPGKPHGQRSLVGYSPWGCKELDMTEQLHFHFLKSQVALVIKNPLPVQERKELRVPSLGQEDPLEEGMVTHSSILAWRIPRTEEPGGLQSMVLQRLRHDLAHMLKSQGV